MTDEKKRRPAWAALGCACALVVAAVALGLRAEWSEPAPPDPAGDPAVDRLVELPLVVTPAAVAADDAGLDDDAEVIGVTADGRHRAYAVSALAPVEAHVVNDMVGTSPVTVAYCDRTNCVRVYKGKARGRPLAARVAGWTADAGGTLVVRVGRTRYRLDTREVFRDDPAVPFPYDASEFVRTTWKAWRTGHPDTDVFVGATPPRSAAPRG